MRRRLQGGRPRPAGSRRAGRAWAHARAEFARLHGIVDRVTEEQAQYKMQSDMAGTGDAGRFAAIAARILEKGADGLRTLEDVSSKLGAVRLAPKAASGARNPEDIGRIGGPGPGWLRP